MSTAPSTHSGTGQATSQAVEKKAGLGEPVRAMTKGMDKIGCLEALLMARLPTPCAQGERLPVLP
jgi:hypothetical protein